MELLLYKQAIVVNGIIAIVAYLKIQRFLSITSQVRNPGSWGRKYCYRNNGIPPYRNFTFYRLQNSNNTANIAITINDCAIATPLSPPDLIILCE
jgi:hypothetical protein